MSSKKEEKKPKKTFKYNILVEKANNGYIAKDNLFNLSFCEKTIDYAVIRLSLAINWKLYFSNDYDETFENVFIYDIIYL